MIKIKAKDIWDNMKHYETPFIEEIMREVGSTVKYDDDVVSFDVEIKNIKVRRAG